MADRNEIVPDEFVFEEAAGLVQVSLIRESERVIGAELRAPEPLSRRARVSRGLAAACLSLNPEDIQSNIHEPQVLSVGLPFLVVELTSREALRRATPSRTGYDRTLPLDGARSVYAYTRGESPTDIYAQMFTPRMTEDPATGSAAGAVACANRRILVPTRHRSIIPLYAGC